MILYWHSERRAENLLMTRRISAAALPPGCQLALAAASPGYTVK